MTHPLEIKVLGSGCSKCRSTVGLIERTAADAGIEIDLTKVETPEEIRRYGVHATPAVVIASEVVHSGGIPSHEAVQAWFRRAAVGFLQRPTRHLFFTGKGGVGKTSLSTAAALTLADAGKKVLLVSTDAASNLDEMLGIELRNTPVPVPGAAGLSVLNIDPDAAAESYRQRVLAQMAHGTPDEELAKVREQLSGACTTEIASFDEFSSLLSDGAEGWDHIVFDTAPTGHTLRLLSLPKAWTGFLAGNDRGASCLGPHSGLKMQEARFNAALAALSDPALTTVILVTRPDRGAINEAARTSLELHELGLDNQRLAVNGVFHAIDRRDAVACAIEDLGRRALDAMPEALRRLPLDQVPLRAFDMVGLPALRALLMPSHAALAAPALVEDRSLALPDLGALADELAASERGVVMVMGKGGVGKTTIAAALAIGLVQRGKTVHLSTTDPAAHLASTLEGELPGLKVSRIDPKVETQRYIDKIMAARSPQLDAQEQALLLEDLQSPCTEEVAVFHAFSRLVAEGRSAFVVLDTAPTGHSMLLMDATGAYHRQMTREFEGHGATRVVTPLMRLQDAAYTKIVLVTLPEVTPVSQAAALQEDLRRASIEPYAWVLNKSLSGAGTHDPLLSARLAQERRQIDRISAGLAQRLYALPWLPVPPAGLAALSKLVDAEGAREPVSGTA
ncbi:arsenical pump-driving ATPase [Piscinibacter gummiphilus]|uniref:Arsenical pump-driving ATPase n=1 Tax=Piscinibacter gummiphilus TaxID=946333 RepID=A0ABZ0D656_9BURK|nr:arsenical pump-driving ATPase [Piscinibacter gummiphilus]WOB10154.1 arsenical pump-driving ATPase [Piscinibacter gummiphilus]